MNAQDLEKVEKAVHAAQFLCSDLRAMHSMAIRKNQLLEVAALDLIQEAQRLATKINLIHQALLRK